MGIFWLRYRSDLDSDIVMQHTTVLATQRALPSIGETKQTLEPEELNYNPSLSHLLAVLPRTSHLASLCTFTRSW